MSRRPLELISPARNLEFGIEAINHGADAVYIGGPSFGARAAAGNPIDHIAKLAAYAHRYSARVLMTLNTILRDDELESARQLAWQAFDAGVDALILQDMGLLEIDLPSISLHASTQTDNRTPEKVRFLEAVGFSQAVLARELSLDAIRSIAGQTSLRLEFFVHGALCVSYSGRCAISHAFTGRSANRGECAQMCRLPYSLMDGEGRSIASNQHLLSLKDNNQSAHLRALADAGISAFKIEGRLKDLSYVKNVTAHYRRLLDNILDEVPEHRRASSGRCTFYFEPAPKKTFNRGTTDYFLQGRQQDIAEFRTPKFAGEPIGRVTGIAPEYFEIDTGEVMHNGDGLSYFDVTGELHGMRINRVEGNRLFPAEQPSRLVIGTAVQRNHDQEFDRQLAHKSAERRIPVDISLAERADGFSLHLCDEDGNSATANLAHYKEAAKDPLRAETTLRENLGKLGETIFSLQSMTLNVSEAWFIPVSKLNALRRQGIIMLEAARLSNYRRPARRAAVEPPVNFPTATLGPLDNVFNTKARQFYARHGVTDVASAFECNEERSEVSLMLTKHCLRYSFNLCPKQSKGLRPDPMILWRGNDKLTLRFDCRRCEMHVIGKLKPRRPEPAAAEESD
ncbi:MAG: peptidase U32 family protein [Betaproteobacteria bacterium]